MCQNQYLHQKVTNCFLINGDEQYQVNLCDTVLDLKVKNIRLICLTFYKNGIV